VSPKRDIKPAIGDPTTKVDDDKVREMHVLPRETCRLIDEMARAHNSGTSSIVHLAVCRMASADPFLPQNRDAALVAIQKLEEKFETQLAQMRLDILGALSRDKK